MAFEPVLPFYPPGSTIPQGTTVSASANNFDITFEVDGPSSLELCAPMDGQIWFYEDGETMANGETANGDSIYFKPHPNHLFAYLNESHSSDRPLSSMVISNVKDVSSHVYQIIALLPQTLRELVWNEIHNIDDSVTQDKIVAWTDDFMAGKRGVPVRAEDVFAYSDGDVVNSVWDFTVSVNHLVDKIWVKDFFESLKDINSDLDSHPAFSAMSSLTAPQIQFVTNPVLTVVGQDVDRTGNEPEEITVTRTSGSDDRFIKKGFYLNKNFEGVVYNVDEIIAYELVSIDFKIELPSQISTSQSIEVFICEQSDVESSINNLIETIPYSVLSNKHKFKGELIIPQGTIFDYDDDYSINVRYYDNNEDEQYFESNSSNLPELKLCYGVEVLGTPDSFLPEYNRDIGRNFNGYLDGIDPSNNSDLEFENNDLSHVAALICQESTPDIDEVTQVYLVEELTFMRDVIENRGIWSRNAVKGKLGSIVQWGGNSNPSINDILTDSNQFQPVDTQNNRLYQPSSASKMEYFFNYCNPENRYIDKFIKGTNEWFRPRWYMVWYYCMKVIGSISFASPETISNFRNSQRSTYCWWRADSVNPNSQQGICSYSPSHSDNYFWKDRRYEEYNEVSGTIQCNGRKIIEGEWKYGD